jgi:rhamnulokinase
MSASISRAGGSVVAIDIGASSGRVVLGRIESGGVQLEEVHRFPNEPVALADGLHWDVLRLYHEVLVGLRLAARRQPEVRSVGIDSWAIDYGLVDAVGALLYQPFHYRDRRNLVAAEEVHRVLAPEALYARTGLQFLPFNTLYQLAASRRSPGFGSAAHVLLMPDLLGFWLTGVACAERTNASTTGYYDPTTRDWAPDLVEAIGVPASMLPTIREPGERLGGLRDGVREQTGLGHDTQVTLVGSHDTASAVVGVPAADRRFAFVSCGTWSLVGVEIDAPILGESGRAANFTNEAGVDGRVRYLRNVMGLWLLQECLRRWDNEGSAEDLARLLAEAEREPRGGPVFDPNDATLLAPADMPAAIEALCRRDGRVPRSRAGLVRSILDSLSAAYARTLADAKRLSGAQVDVVHLVGGGSQNVLLCQLTADACRLPVLAGPTEATVFGNVLVQARALGWVSGDLEALRRISRASSTLRRYEPTDARAGTA